MLPIVSTNGGDHAIGTDNVEKIEGFQEIASASGKTVAWNPTILGRFRKEQDLMLLDNNSKDLDVVSLMSWRNMCKPIMTAGMNFRDLGLFNQALLAKLSLRIHQSPDLLLSQVLRAKYGRGRFVLGGKNSTWLFVGLALGTVLCGLHAACGEHGSAEGMSPGKGNITIGSSLTADVNNSSWVSPSGGFAFSFLHIGTGDYLLAIWFNNIP
ncbi:hypothetical protein RHMOL_Rhmol12G0227000 [Rhododendron molle]|uniref:Uncharacterized protein n=1 Tax=Rhododendron molle TaxID=49168 RepID=A0ACC0LLG4_RHOML|nr:hypothetical protein RHMOL_Rhmol12G0227000 [Rhododendron molle]